MTWQDADGITTLGPGDTPEALQAFAGKFRRALGEDPPACLWRTVDVLGALVGYLDSASRLRDADVQACGHDDALTTARAWEAALRPALALVADIAAGRPTGDTELQWEQVAL